WRPYLNYTFGGQYGFSLNASIPAIQGGILSVREGQYVIGGTAGKNNGTYIMQGNLWALNLDPSKGALGSLLWNITYTPPQEVYPDIVSTATAYFGQGKMSSPMVDPEDGVFLFNEPVQRTWWAFSLATGKQLWKSAPEDQWNYYGMGYDIYNGMLLSIGSGQTGSQLVAYDIKTGAILYNWIPTQVGSETPYGTYPLDMGCIANGNIYLYSRDHHQDTLLPRGSAWWCLNASNGQLLWKLGSWGSGVAVSDGYLVGWNAYDNQIYCIGMGPSKMTLAPVTNAVTQGSSIAIQGTISDQSAGAPAAATKQGLQYAAAVSDKDQEQYMEFLYEQQSFPSNAVGVQVRLTAFDPNNNTEDLGTVTSNAYGLFSLKWTPPVPGLYTITASFAGSNSYGPSTAQCAVAVDAKSASPAVATPSPIVTAQLTPTPTGTPTPTAVVTLAPTPSPVVIPPTSATPTMTYAAIGAAIIVIIAVAAALILRRRK
ncbi:MAG TPA: hypothetical protein VMD05_06320, partial [Candidatus Nanoarchaeia archaeon]|nr:hypothetical protein [Candidatus Nanoarchaeia archaeon]